MGIVIYRLYEWVLLKRIVILPSHICFMITGEDLRNAPEKLAHVAHWCRDVNRHVAGTGITARGPETIEGVTVHISTSDPEEIVPFLREIRKVRRYASLVMYPEGHEEGGTAGIEFGIAVGTSGRDEIVSCIRSMAADGMMPDDVDEEAFERCLTFRYTPDLVIKTGGYHLTDFLIWQSVYSELFFSDVNWKLFRKTDFLRALRDYQARVRRFGT